MKKTNTVTNLKVVPIELIVEPAALCFNVQPKQKVIIEIEYDKESAPLDLEIDDESIVLYEGHGMRLNIQIGDKLVYTTDWS